MGRLRFIEIDEIENSVHFELVAYFLKCFLANSEGKSQLLITTHDINLLNEDFLRRVVVWFTDKNNNGETILERLSSIGNNKGISPYNAYRQGKLIKLPFLESIFFDLSILPDHEKKITSTIQKSTKFLSSSPSWIPIVDKNQ